MIHRQRQRSLNRREPRKYASFAVEGIRVSKKIVTAILVSGLLCAVGYAQSAEIFGDIFVSDMHSRCKTAPWNLWWTQGFPQSCTQTIELGVAAKHSISCVSRKSIVLELLERSRDGQSFHELPVWQLLDSQAFFFVSRMTIGADGAPNAYHPDDAGLDELANAGAPGHWDGIVTDRYGRPLIQHENDPFPGYYISCTSLFDSTKNFADPRGYVDASTIPYIALPKELASREGLQLGDFAFVVNLRNGRSSYAIYADIGTFGEGSIALADALGVSSNARHGGQSRGILYLLFPGSGNQRPRTIAEIQGEGEKLLSQTVNLNGAFSCSATEGPVFNSGDF